MIEFIKRFFGIKHKHKFVLSDFIEKASLKDGFCHTMVELNKCSCGLWECEISPSSNFCLAVSQGSEITLNQLRRLGIPIGEIKKRFDIL